MLGFALLGAGLAGHIHAGNLVANRRVNFVSIYDVVAAAGRELAAKHGVALAPDVDAVLSDRAVDAVVIASPTATHVDLLTAAAKAGKAVFCEKPVDLDLDRVVRCREEVAGLEVPIQIGFNRRFDPSHRAVYDAVRNGEVGQVEMVIISSRDPEPPPIDYVKSAGGLYRDMMVHDFDMARFLLGEEPVAVSAMGSALVDAEIGRIGHIDTAMAMMRAESGALCHLDNSFRATYGYDQRVEVFGSRGMVRSDNLRPTSIERYRAQATAVRDPLLPFFAERYAASYAREIDDFIDSIEAGREPSVTFDDGYRALVLAAAADESLATGRAVTVTR